MSKFNTKFKRYLLKKNARKSYKNLHKKLWEEKANSDSIKNRLTEVES